MAFLLQCRENVGHGLLRCMLGELNAAERALFESEGELSQAVVHKTRRRLKKCRACLRLMCDGDADDLPGECNILLRDAGRALSRTRDARVALATFRRLPKMTAPARRALTPLRGLLVKNTALHESAQTPARDAMRLIRAAEAKLRAFAGIDFGGRELAEGLTRLYRPARGAERGWLASGDAAHLHEWRKRIKDLYYALRLVRRRCPPSAERMAGRLRDLGKITGLRLDLEVLLRVAGAMVDPIPVILLKLIAAERRRLDRRAKKIARKLFKRKPEEFRRNVLRW
jgi:hypothetical protein